MNVVVKILPQPYAAKIAHSVMGYDKGSDELALELPIPLFLDTLALKIARVPPEDKYGGLSYVLEPSAVETFRFLLGLQVDMSNRDYFLESTLGHTARFGPAKLEAVELLSQVTPRPRYVRTDKPRISERELVLPTLRLLDESNTGTMTTSKLIKHLTKLFSPSGQDAEILDHRSDTYFSQKVRNMISHRHQPSSFINRGLVDYIEPGLKISKLGRATVRALLA